MPDQQPNTNETPTTQPQAPVEMTVEQPLPGGGKVTLKTTGAWIILVILVAIVAAGVFWWWKRGDVSGGQAIQADNVVTGLSPEDLLQRIERLTEEKTLLAVERDQERAQAEAAIARAQAAESRGDPEAAKALERAEFEGKPDALLQWLIRQAAASEADVIERQREIAALAYLTGEIEIARAALDKILALAPDDLDATNRLGHILRLRGELNAAEAAYRKVLMLAGGDQVAQAAAYGSLGNVYLTRGELDEAEEYFKKSLAIDETLGRKEGIADAYGNLGNVYRTRGDLEEAERHFKKALAINETLGRNEGMAYQHLNLGALVAQRDNLNAAREHWSRALDLYRQLGAKPMIEKVQGRLDSLPPPDP